MRFLPSILNAAVLDATPIHIYKAYFSMRTEFPTTNPRITPQPKWITT